MDKKYKEKCNLMGKIAKIEKFILKIEILLSLIQLYLLIFKNIRILKLIVAIMMVLFTFINVILTFKVNKLKNEILYGIIHKSAEAAEPKGYKVVWEDEKTVKIIKKGEENE